MSADARTALERVFRAALRAVDPAEAVRRQLSRHRGGVVLAGEPLSAGTRLALLAVGKASLPMAAALTAELGPAVSACLVVAPDGAPGEVPGARVLRSAHPVPDARSEAAGRAALRFVARREPDEVLVALLSGGASSLLSCPAPGLALADLARTTSLLLASGAAIDALNTVRRHLSAVAGGRLARASAAARTVVLVVSDVLGDRLEVIGSGPFAPDPTAPEDAAAVLRDRDLWDRVPPPVRAHLAEASPVRAPAAARVRHVVIADNRTALAAAVAAGRLEGRTPCVVSEQLAGEARLAGRHLAALGAAIRRDRPRLLLAGGETTVTVRGAGRGGRSQELALAAALALAGGSGVSLLAAGTDGRDGPTDAAGAFADPATVRRGAAHGVDARARLEDNDAHGFFAAEGGLLRTGPTGTNVMDLVLVACDPAAPG